MAMLKQVKNMGHEHETDIIIVSYKDKEDIKSCIASIERVCSRYTLIIEDNNIENRGFTKAVNDGIKKGKSEFVWLLNSDTVLKDEDSQKALLDFLHQNPKTGIVGSMQIDPNNHDRIAYGGSQRTFPSGVHKGGLISLGHCRFPEKQTWINAASMMIRRAMIDEIGFLDESMYLLYSDSDYSYVSRKHGWECWYVPESQVYHTLKVSKGMSEWHRKDMEAFMRKWKIRPRPDGSFEYGREFAKLDMFP